MRLLFSIVGHLATATVLAVVIGCAYLWQSNMLTNEKVFRIVAVLHGIDLEAIAAEEATRGEETPPEETSLDEISRLREVKLRNYEVKLNALKQGRQDFDTSFRRISEATARFDRLAKELEDRLKKQGELSTKENLAAVVNQLQSLKPEEAKQQLLMYLDKPQGEQDVITLMKSMRDGELRKILQRFKTPEELQKLHKLHSLMLQGYPDKPAIDSMLERVRRTDDKP